MTLRLLIGYDGNPSGRQALAYVAPLVRDGTILTTLLTVARNTTITAGLFDEASRIVEGARLEHIGTTGSLYGALVQATRARTFDLAVFGPPGRAWTRLSRWRQRGSLSAALPISSLLVQGEARGITRALICTGGDETVIADARLTAQLARRAAAPATILHVLSQVPLIFGRGTDREQITDAFAATGAPEMKHMRAAADVLKADGVEAAIKIRIGLVVEEIVAELAEGGYDLLVVGAHRSHGLVERLLLEDVTADIVPHSPVPVLVVKTAQKAPGDKEEPRRFLPTS